MEESIPVKAAEAAKPRVLFQLTVCCMKGEVETREPSRCCQILMTPTRLAEEIVWRVYKDASIDEKSACSAAITLWADGAEPGESLSFRQAIVTVLRPDSGIQILRPSSFEAVVVDHLGRPIP